MPIFSSLKRSFFFFFTSVFAGPVPLSLAGEAQGMVTVNENYLLFGILILIVCLGLAAFGWIREKKSNRFLADRLAAIKKSREKYRIMADKTGVGILIIQDFTFKYANLKAYEIMGLEKGETRSENLLDYIFPDDLDLVLEHYEKSLLSLGETHFTTRILRADKTAHWLRVRSVSILFQGRPANLSFIRDVTGLKHMEMNLQQAQRMEAIGVLAGGIAHDFNNILTTIIGNAELALMDLVQEDPSCESFQQIQVSGHRARELVQQILTLSRSQAGDVFPLDLTSVIKEALKLLRSTLPSNIRIVENIDKNAGKVKVDVTRIYQVFMNLCTNAKYAMEKKDTGILTVWLTRVDLLDEDPENRMALPGGGYVKLRVIDNGEGIEPGIRDKIFQPYFSTKNMGDGTGLGLATSLEIIKKYKGDIACQSDVGKGSEFSVFLPVHENPSLAEDEIDEIKDRTLQGNILFVDDEKEISLIVKKIFKTFGYTVVTAGSGKEALEQVIKDPDFFNLLITDMGMPGMTGEQLIKEVIRIRSDLPLILCTGHSDTFDQQKARNLGIREYIAKPYSLKDLLSLAARYIK